MKLKVVRTYAQVEFQSNLESFFSTALAKFAGIEMELLKNGLVSIRTAKSHVLIPLTNIAFIVPIDAPGLAQDRTLDLKTEQFPPKYTTK